MASSQYDVIVIYGGRSPEHEVSCRSAKFVARTVQSLGHRLHLVGIHQNGTWYLQDVEKALIAPGRELPITEEKSVTNLLRDGADHPVAQVLLRICRSKKNPLDHPIVVFPVIHGIGGEDGSLQGILDYGEIPYVGPDLLGSAIGMDKVISKKLVEAAGIKVVPSMVLLKGSNPQNLEEDAGFQDFMERYGFPLFVKPARLGSSVGVSRALNKRELLEGCRKALQYDDKILIERAVSAREIEVGVLGHHLIEASLPGEVIVNADFYSFDAKYVHKTQAKTQVPAELTVEQTEEVRRLAKRCFEALTLSGMSRVDFFFDRESQEFLFNEVNTIPGFTEISLFPVMWAQSGLRSEELVSKLIQLAINRQDSKAGLSRLRNEPGKSYQQ